MSATLSVHSVTPNEEEDISLAHSMDTEMNNRFSVSLVLGPFYVLSSKTKLRTKTLGKDAN